MQLSPPTDTHLLIHSVAAHDDSISIGSSSHLRPLHKKTTNHPVSRAVV